MKAAAAQCLDVGFECLKDFSFDRASQPPPVATIYAS